MLSTNNAVRRFWPLVVGTVLAGGITAGLLSYTSAVSYAGTGIYLVPPHAATATTAALTPYDAERLARTYAVVIAEDADVLATLGRAVGRSQQGTSERTSTVTLPNSAAVRVSYRGRTRSEVRSYFDALNTAVSSVPPPTPNLAPDTLSLLRVDDRINRSGGGSPVPVAAGAVAGLLLGLGAASYLGRVDVRVRSAETLREPDGPAVVDVDLRQHDSVRALARRVVEEVPLRGRVAVVAADEDAAASAAALTVALREATGDLIDGHVLHSSFSEMTWEQLPLVAGGQRLAQDADRTLVVTAARQRIEQVARTVSDLYDLGVNDMLLAVVHGTPARR